MDNLIFVSRSSILDFTSSLGHVYPFFRDHKYERYFKLGCDSVFSNRRYSMSWRTSISGSQGSRRHLSRRSVRISSNWADPALWKEGAGQKRARIVIQGNCCLCYDRVLHQETQGLEIKTRASDRVHWKPEAKCKLHVGLALAQLVRL